MEHLKKMLSLLQVGVKHKCAQRSILCGGQRATCGAGSFLSLYIGSGNRTWAVGFVCQAFCPLSHLPSSHTRWFFSFPSPGSASIPHHTLAHCLVSPPVCIIQYECLFWQLGDHTVWTMCTQKAAQGAISPCDTYWDLGSVVTDTVSPLWPWVAWLWSILCGLLFTRWCHSHPQS